ncbi:hypothetical protein CHARACLAT_021443 [Characodon lateralis]|uniref:Uncharacterized protein n=1 Tax=Characodon lateralis TaxID=208331 RepID=A0ABU7D3P2_9TELE|nr:hypothetical protein [Characodon lateralis]
MSLHTTLQARVIFSRGSQGSWCLSPTVNRRIVFPFQGLPQRSPVFIEPHLLHFFSYTHYLQVLFDSILKSPLWSSSRPPAWHFQPHHPSTDVLSIPSLNMSKPSQSGRSGFISKTLNMSCPSDKVIPDPIHPHHSK